jgi:hypothetical protein
MNKSDINLERNKLFLSKFVECTDELQCIIKDFLENMKEKDRIMITSDHIMFDNYSRETTIIKNDYYKNIKILSCNDNLITGKITMIENDLESGINTNSEFNNNKEHFVIIKNKTAYSPKQNIEFGYNKEYNMLICYIPNFINSLDKPIDMDIEIIGNTVIYFMNINSYIN